MYADLIYGRAIGRTHAAMAAAPVGSFYVVPNVAMLDYCRDMAHKIGRTDLKLLTMAHLPRIRAVPCPIRVDHAVWDMGLMSWQDMHMLYNHRAYCRIRGVD